MKINLLNNKNNNIAISHFDVTFLKIITIRYDIISKVILWQKSNRRSIIACTKSVSDISYSNRKIYSQKGTGNARHGSRKRNIFRGGAISFGPKSNKKYSYSLNKKMKRLALKHSIYSKLSNGTLLVYNKLFSSSKKTVDFLKIYNFVKNNKTIFIDLNFDMYFYLSCRNVPNVFLMDIRGINVYDILNSDILCFSFTSFCLLESRLSSC